MKISSSFTIISRILSVIILCLAIGFERKADQAESFIVNHSRFLHFYKSKINQLTRYESAEKYFDSFSNIPSQPEIPIHITNPSQITTHPPLLKSSGWTHYQTSFSWDSIPIRSALEAVSALGAMSDGWNIGKLSFLPLPDGVNANVSITLETVRRISL